MRARWWGFWRIGHPCGDRIKKVIDVQTLAPRIDAGAKFIFDLTSRLALITVILAAQILTKSAELLWLWSILVLVLSAWISYTLLNIASPWSSRATTAWSALVGTVAAVLLIWGASSFISKVSLALLEATPALQAIKSLEREILVNEQLLNDTNARMESLEKQRDVDREEYKKLDEKARELEKILMGDNPSK